MRLRTLRGRLLLSSVLWTVGLLFVSAVPFSLRMEQQSRLRVAITPVSCRHLAREAHRDNDAA